MNPRLGLLQPYPFEKVRTLLAGATPPAGRAPINLSIGEPQHPTPGFLKEALAANLGGLARYPVTKGLPETRAAIAGWIARRHGLASIHPDTQVLPVTRTPEANLAIAHALGRDAFPRLIVMGSLSKRSNAPGLRSGFAAGDRALIERFALYRTYHGTAMSNVVQMASIAAWNDEAHVVENRRLYREKFEQFHRIVDPVLPLTRPQAAFYYWAAVGGDDAAFTRELFEATHMTVMPGSYFSREAQGVNPGRGFVRVALVGTLEESLEAAGRLRDFAARGAGKTLRKTVHG